MKAISSVITFISIAGVAFSVVACGGGNNSSSTPAPGVAVATTTGCVYTQAGWLPQGSCPAGQGQYTVGANNGIYGGSYNGGVYNGVNNTYTSGQCLPQITAPTTTPVNNGIYGNNGAYGNNGVYGANGVNGQCGQVGGQNGITYGTNGCIQTQMGCFPQCMTLQGQPGLEMPQGCAPYSYFGIYSNGGGGVIPPYGYGPGYPGYIPGGGGNFGTFYYYRGF